MTSAIEAYLAKLANELGPRSRGLVAEARDHLLAAAEEMEASGVDRRAAEVAALERFGREHELIASFTRELDEEEEDLMEQSSLRRLTSLLLIAGLALGINAALNSYGSVHATPLRTAVAIGLFAACLVGVRCVLLGTVGVGGAIGLALCALGVMASFDRDGVGFGLGGALFAMGVAYSALGLTLFAEERSHRSLVSASGCRCSRGDSGRPCTSWEAGRTRCQRSQLCSSPSSASRLPGSRTRCGRKIL